MHRLVLMAALFLTACAPRQIEIPPTLTEQVLVECVDHGNVMSTLGRCAMDLREGLDAANGRLGAIRELADTP
jgi:hypothetical protein